jgi:hypothetical protein
MQKFHLKNGELRGFSLSLDGLRKRSKLLYCVLGYDNFDFLSVSFRQNKTSVWIQTQCFLEVIFLLLHIIIIIAVLWARIRSDPNLSEMIEAGFGYGIIYPNSGPIRNQNFPDHFHMKKTVQFSLSESTS